MRAAILFLLFVFAISLHAKDTKKITGIYLFPNFEEVYYVLKSDTSVKHGAYRAETMGKVLAEGHFRMGVMDSIWTQYDKTGIIRSRGWFENNNRYGIWEFFDKKGELEQKIDFSTNEILLYRTALTHNPFRVVSGRDTLMSILDRPPLYIGGQSRLNDYLMEKMRIPLHKQGEKITGNVFVAFTIDSIGKTSNHHVLKGIGKVCDSEALRIAKTIPQQWIPGVINGKNVTIEYILPITFDSNIRGIDPIDLESKSTESKE